MMAMMMVKRKVFTVMIKMMMTMTMTMTMVEGEYVYGALTVTTPAESLLTSFFVHHIIPNVLIVSIIIPVITIIGI